VTPAPARVLVINVTRVGDTILTTPVLRALAKAWPQAKLTFLGHPKRVEVVEHLPFVAETGAISKQRAPWRGRLFPRRWDLALVYGHDLPLIDYALRVSPRVVAFRQKEAAVNERLYRAVEPATSQRVHAVHQLLLLPGAIGIESDGLRLSYQVTPAEKAWAREYLAALPGPLVGLQIAGFHATSYRDWPLERFAELCERMRARWPKVHLMLFGGAAERERTGELARRIGGRVTNLAGTVTLRQSAALLDRLDLYIGVDTGPTHIMSALDAPMVALYHCHSSSQAIGPLERPRCYVVDHPRPAPCSADVPMAELEVEPVWAKVLEAASTPAFRA
jgi:heptosyltransferase III